MSKTMNITRRSALLHLGTALGASTCLALPAWAQQYTMKLSTTAAADLDVAWLNALKANVETASHGAIKGQVYPASQLGTAQRTIEGVTMGTVEMVLNASGMYEGLEPRFGALAIP